MFILALALGALAGHILVAQLRERIGASLQVDAARIAERLTKEMSARSRELNLLGALDPQRNLPSTAAVQALLDGLRRSVPSYLWIGITDANGRILAASDPALVGTDFVGRAGLRDPPPARVGQREEIRPIALVHPVRSRDGSVGNTVSAQLGWTWVRELERSLVTSGPDLPGARQVVLLASNDLVLVGPPDLQGTRLTLGSASRARAGFPGWAVERYPSGGDYLTGAAYAEGEPPFPGPGSDAMKWTVLVREHLDAAFAPAAELQQGILLVGLAVAAVFAGLGWLVAARITKPLQEIARAADRLRQGEDAELPRIRGVAAEIETLSASLNALVATLTSKETALSAMEVAAQHDALTGLLNRHGFEEWLKRARVRARLKETGLLVLMGDLDGFKGVNDTLGHPAGDQLLRAVAQRLTHNVRSGRDAVARLGGDEFVVALDAPAGLGDLDALETAKRVWAAVSGRYELEGQIVRVGLSLGGAFWPEDAADLDDAVRQADQALYAAKRAGKGRIALHRDLGIAPARTPASVTTGPATA